MEPMIPLPAEAAALRAGDPALPEYVERLCARIDRLDPVVRAFVPEPGRHHRLAEAARELQARTDGTAPPAHRTPPAHHTSPAPPAAPPAGRPPLYGVAVGVKDVIQVAGLPTHAGSALPPGVLGGPQASLVTRLLAAGALVAGKTVTAEFAVRAPGPTRNPRDPAHTPGGSSSGSAAAVAAGLVPLAVGTQTVGSVIRPAAYCGVVGFRPSYGRIPVDGVIAHSPSLDTVGVFTSDLAGARLAATVLCDDWRPGPAEAAAGSAVPAGGRPPVCAVPGGAYLERAEPAARAEFDRTLRLLREHGLTIRALDLPADFDGLVQHLRLINRYELAQVHAELFARFGALYRPETAAAIRRGHEITAADHSAALHARDGFRRRLAAFTADEGIDLWLTPAATGPAPRGLDSTGDAVMSLPWSYAGAPAVTLPAGRLGRLPLGLQCVGAVGADEELLACAAHVEQALAGAGKSG
ncbi:amidase [Kitasatospora sp. NPDC048540]|uniref:amidase n=1 Tax=unclassified Kitasatospora TaxID=2633591 RepID=UPI00053B798F|nr:amidase [Kitasatospora sp. MBT63]